MDSKFKNMTLLLAGVLAATYFSVPPADAPELAARGPYEVGVRTIELVHKDQVDILHVDKATGKAPLYDRPLTVEVWYPAQVPAGTKIETVYKMPVPGGQTLNGSPTIDVVDKALRDATPVTGKTFPLVVVSHGYPGSRYFLSYLTANLASKGYVVAAIDHTDSVFDGQRGFESTLLNRSRDQLFVMDSMAGVTFLDGILDSSKVAVVGYSMGGYGALSTAGATFNDKGMPLNFVPGGYMKGALAEE